MRHLTVAVSAICSLLLAGAEASDWKAAPRTDTPAAPRLAKPAPRKIKTRKPTAPVEISSPALEPLPPDTDTRVQFTVTPQADCADAQAKLRARGGVKLVERQIPAIACEQGVPTVVNALVRIPSGASGSVVLDLRLKAEGRPYSISRSVQIAAHDAIHVPRNIGRQGRDADGQPVIEVPLEESR